MARWPSLHPIHLIFGIGCWSNSIKLIICGGDGTGCWLHLFGNTA
jgi:hypothetical protein